MVDRWQSIFNNGSGLRLDETTRRLVSRISVTLSLEATDRGAAAGLADDPPVKTQVKLSFNDALEARASTPSAARREVTASSRNKGTCKAVTKVAAGRRHEWSQSPTLPKVLFAGEAVGVVAMARDVDRVTPSCEAGEPGCQRGNRTADMDLDEFHPITWSVDNADGFSGGPGSLAGGQTTPAGVFVAPASSELIREGVPVCSKPVVLSVTSMADGDLSPEATPAAKRATVMIKAGRLRSPVTSISGLPGQPVEVRFELYKIAEDGVPLAGNVPF